MKHAYLIMAHKNLNQLLRLLRALDDARNDIYLHLDSRFREADEVDFTGFLNFSCFYSIPRRTVEWGSYGIVQTEFELLQAAAEQGPYRYYHLLSGQDFPIKSQSDIHHFFDGQDKEFIHFADPSGWDRVMRIRLNRFRRPIYQIYLLSEFLKRRTGIRPPVDFGFGSEWFSITDKFAKDFLAKRRWASRYFANCICPDELVLQTFVLSFGYENHLAAAVGTGDETASKRCIDWNRGDDNHPYVWRTADYQILANSNAMFARKFDTEIDENILRRIEETLL
ncbi:beta-1,6-N-acetylglucosaminyltransferase [Hornefia butyriciproducens]|uniref:beta-1,6-N-acetylglucosaminyltransferase n=1 Tax=Hornefia butyriciproducens TaxID=2652293 RepID=UPI002A915C58|nr:beta-1,6-N-acetylglucosaminyltransferase [Hornefia butyriciproducens]MDY5423146.1 beta-1,6-N-acetylglucosaminyltransferase [Hornefia butyriciproducens]